MNVLVTGSSGFIGGAVIRHLISNEDIKVYVALRSVHEFKSNFGRFSRVTFCKLDENQLDWPLGVRIDVVIHAAGQSNSDKVSNNLAFKRLIASNVTLTTTLALDSLNNKVSRFIFISSLKVNGEKCTSNKAMTEEDLPRPQDSYALSKLMAEKELLRIAENTDMDVVIIRPPIVYGPGMKGALGNLIKLTLMELPLPFKKISNRRSFIAIDNLISFISLCLDKKKTPQASNEVFIISDDCDLSISTLLTKISFYFNKKNKLFYLPPNLLKLIAIILGKKTHGDRILNSLFANISKAKLNLNWKPIVTLNQQVKKMSNYDKNI